MNVIFNPRMNCAFVMHCNLIYYQRIKHTGLNTTFTVLRIFKDIQKAARTPEMNMRSATSSESQLERDNPQPLPISST